MIRQNVKGRVLFRDKHPIHKSEWEIERWRTRSWTVTEAWQSLSQHARTLGVHIEHIRTIREVLIWTETDWQSVPGCGQLWTGVSLDKLFAAGGYVLSADYTPTSWATKASMLHSSALNPKHLIKEHQSFLFLPHNYMKLSGLRDWDSWESIAHGHTGCSWWFSVYHLHHTSHCSLKWETWKISKTCTPFLLVDYKTLNISRKEWAQHGLEIFSEVRILLGWEDYIWISINKILPKVVMPYYGCSHSLEISIKVW